MAGPGSLRFFIVATYIVATFVNGEFYEWSHPMDRAKLLLNGTEFSNDLILWQNNEGEFLLLENNSIIFDTKKILRMSPLSLDQKSRP